MIDFFVLFENVRILYMFTIVNIRNFIFFPHLKQHSHILQCHILNEENYGTVFPDLR